MTTSNCYTVAGSREQAGGLSELRQADPLDGIRARVA